MLTISPNLLIDKKFMQQPSATPYHVIGGSSGNISRDLLPTSSPFAACVLRILNWTIKHF